MNGIQCVRVHAAHDPPAPSERFLAQRQGQVEVVHANVRSREVADGGQRIRVFVSQKAPAFCQRLDVQRQGQVVVAHSVVQRRDITDGG